MEMFTKRFSAMIFYFSFMSGLMDFRDIAILCSRPTKLCFDKPLFSLGLFS